jgi:Caspase domain
MGLPDPQHSRAVLIGTSLYEDESLPNLPSVANNMRDLASSLSDSRHGAVHGTNCIAIENEGDIRNIGRRLKVAAEQAEDLLLVYYSGHGLIGGRKHDLYLALSSSEWGAPEFNSLEYSKLRDAVLGSRANTKVVILDCCFSGRATTAPLADPAAQLIEQVEVEGTYVLTSALRDQVALALPGEMHTAFTGRLLKIMRNGILGGPEFLTIDLLYRELFAKMRAEGLPLPQKQGVGNAERLAIVRNQAYTATPLREHLSPVMILDWDIIIQSLRVLVQQQTLSGGTTQYEDTESISQRILRASMLHDALAGQSRTIAGDSQNTSHPPVESLHDGGYRDRAALLVQALRPGFSARRAQQERLVAARRGACIDLFRAAIDLRALVANTFDYYGSEMESRLQEIRASGRAIQVYGLALTLLATENLIDPANRLAAAATLLAEGTLKMSDISRGLMISAPDFSELDSCSEDFRDEAISQARSDQAKHSGAVLPEACLVLFRIVTDLRVRVANDSEYSGPGMALRLAEQRICSASVQVHAFNLALLAPELAPEAVDLASAARRLVTRAEDYMDLTRGVVIRAPDFVDLDRSFEALRQRLPLAVRPQP